MSLAAIRAALEGQLASLPNIVPAVSIATSLVASPTVISTLTPHGIPVGTTVLATISGHVGSTPAISGIYRAKATGASTLTLQTNAPTPANVAVTVAGAGGTFRANLTAYENVAFDPVAGVPYERINIVPATPRAAALSGASKIRRGFMQVTLCWPINVGTGGASARVDAIEAGFPNNTTISGVKIMSPADVTLLGVDGDRDVTVVRIRFSDR